MASGARAARGADAVRPVAPIAERLAMATIAGGPAAVAGPAPAIGGYILEADAPGVALIYNDPDPTVGAQGLTIPQTTAQFSTGFGHGLATVVWPGNTVGNAGGLANVLNIPEPVRTILKQDGNDPIRAETFSPSGPKDATYPPGGASGTLTMRSHADPARVESWSSYSSLGMAPVSVGSVASHSLARPDSSAALSEADSQISDVDIGAVGSTVLLHIGSISSIATAKSDGSIATGSGSTTVSGLRVAGIPATLDDHGLHVGGGSTDILSPANDALTAVLGATGLQVVLARPSLDKSGAKASASAGSIVVSFSQQGQSFTVTMGGATASANAAPALNTTALTAPAMGSPANAAAGTAPPAAAIGTTGGPSTATALGSGPAGTGSEQDVTAGPVALGLAVSAPPFTHVAWGVVVLGLIGVALAAVGMRRVPDTALAPKEAGTVCPLADRSSR
jgi:hypothetical protein